MPNQDTRPRNPRSKKASEGVNDYDRIPPQATDLEAAVLGALMIDQDAYPQVSELLKPESFYEHRNQLVYKAIQDLAMRTQPIDLLTVKSQLEQNGTLEEVGGPYYIAQLTSQVASAAHVEYHARIIAQKSLARELISFSSYVQGKAFDETQDVANLMEEAQGQLFTIAQQSVRKNYTQISPILAEAREKIMLASQNTGGLSGLESGFHALDSITSGWQNSDLIIIAARPAMGKTAFVLSMAKNMAVDYHIPCAFFSLEMSNLQLVNRLIANTCQIEHDHIRSGQLDREEWTRLDNKMNDMMDAPLYIDDTPSLSVQELFTKARRLVSEHGIKIIFIDYLQLMNASGMKFGNRQEEVSTISRSLKALAKELNIPIVALSQLNRSVEKGNAPSQDGRNDSIRTPQLSDLRESGAIEQDADMVCFIHRPEYYKIYTDDHGRNLRGLAQIIIAKHRNGAVGEVLLGFEGRFTRFYNFKEEAADFSSGGRIVESAINSPIGSDANPPFPGPDDINAGASPLGPGSSEVPF